MLVPMDQALQIEVGIDPVNRRVCVTLSQAANLIAFPDPVSAEQFAYQILMQAANLKLSSRNMVQVPGLH